ncbi:ADAMTS-like protein 3, partial [Ophiophagus hannah]
MSHPKAIYWDDRNFVLFPGCHISMYFSEGDCKDTTRYCTSVKHLNLCSVGIYKQRCCQSCREG